MKRIKFSKEKTYSIRCRQCGKTSSNDCNKTSSQIVTTEKVYS